MRRKWKRTDPFIEYLLLTQLNSNCVTLSGSASNEGLKDVFLSLLRRVNPNIFCDIGAYDGRTSLMVRDALPACKIYAFEANPEVYNRHQSSLAKRGFQYLNMAISDRSGSATIFVPRTLSKAYVDGQVVEAALVEPEHTGKASLLLRNENATYAEFAVETNSLDGFFRAQEATVEDKLFALWIDAEGSGANVLAGAEAVLRRTAIVFIEVEGFDFWKNQVKSPGISRFLIARGFIPVARDYEYGDKQFNLLFLNSHYVNSAYDDLFSLSSGLSMLKRGQANIEPVQPHDQPAGSGFRRQAGHMRAFPSVSSYLQGQVPIFIPTFNNPTYLRMMVDQLSHFGMQNIIIVDNGSCYPPFLSLLKSLEGRLTVIHQAENRGPQAIVEDEDCYSLLPEYFCLTDPDLEFNANLPSDFLVQLIKLTEAHRIGKAGFALDISHPEAMWQEDFIIGGEKYKIWDWESQFWQDSLSPDSTGNPVYKGGIDTTFALYNKKFFRRDAFHEAIRVAGDFTCRHLPWYREIRLPPDEEAYYRKTSKFSHYLRNCQ
jgi:FkbM family methyltransferase